MPRFLPDKVAVTCEFMLGDEEIRPGNLLKIKNVYGPVLYQCLVTDLENDITYAWCKHNGKWRAFNMTQIKCRVLPKRSFKNRCKS